MQNELNRIILSILCFKHLYTVVMGGPSTYAQVTIEATRLLGSRVRQARIERRWTVEELAERMGVSPVTLRKVEKGDPTVALGTAFEAATLVGVALFHHDPLRRRNEAEYVVARLAVLPAAVRTGQVDDNF